jgi:hypothetical protein
VRHVLDWRLCNERVDFVHQMIAVRYRDTTNTINATYTHDGSDIRRHERTGRQQSRHRAAFRLFATNKIIVASHTNKVTENEYQCLRYVVPVQKESRFPFVVVVLRILKNNYNCKNQMIPLEFLHCSNTLVFVLSKKKKKKKNTEK